MGVRVLADRGGDEACMYCSVTMWAFGPVFGRVSDLDAEEACEEFIRWHFEKHGDPRRATDTELIERMAEFAEGE